MSAQTADMTPQDLRVPLLAAALPHVAFDGWTDSCFGLAAEDAGVSKEMAELAFPGKADEMLEAYLAANDAHLKHALSEKDLPAMKIRDRITVAIRTKLELQRDEREVVRRTLAALALPQNLVRGPKALWQTADTMWRAAGDTSTDHNWYTKRMTLSGVLSAVILYWLNDDSEDLSDTWAFLDRRIEDVMKIETAKWQMRKACDNMPSLSRFLGHLRYPGA
jgi:ubiquinone biosynthesis protein COQ9